MSALTSANRAAVPAGACGLKNLLATVATRSDTVGQFARFVAVGGTSMALYALLFMGLQDQVGTQTANVLGSLASAMLANELHRRLTFSASGQVSWVAAQLQGGGMSMAGIAATSLALTWLNGTIGPTSALVHLFLVTTVNGLIGLARFIGLRWAFVGPS